MDVNKLKAGDCVMYDRGSVAYPFFAIIESIERRPMQFGKEKIILNLKDVYSRQRVTKDGTINEDIFSYEYKNILPISPDSKDKIESKLYNITKAEYNAVEEAVRAYFKERDRARDILGKIYFEQKRK